MINIDDFTPDNIIQVSLLLYFIRINVVCKNFNSASDIPKDKRIILQRTLEKVKLRITYKTKY